MRTVRDRALVSNNLYQMDQRAKNRNKAHLSLPISQGNQIRKCAIDRPRHALLNWPSLGTRNQLHRLLRRRPLTVDMSDAWRIPAARRLEQILHLPACFNGFARIDPGVCTHFY